MEKYKITLREWRATDAEALAKHADNRKIADNLRDGFPNPYTIDAAHDYIRFAMASSSENLLYAIDFEGEAIGSIGAFFKNNIYRKNAEIGYWLSEKYWGNRIITDAIKQITKIIFENYDIVRVYAEPFSTNAGSCKALENAGFILEAVFRNNVIKNDIVRDSKIYSILKDEYLKLNN